MSHSFPCAACAPRLSELRESLCVVLCMARDVRPHCTRPVAVDDFCFALEAVINTLPDSSEKSHKREARHER